MDLFMLADFGISAIIMGSIAAASAIASGAASGANASKNKKSTLHKEAQDRQWFDKERYLNIQNTQDAIDIKNRIAEDIKEQQQIAEAAGENLGLSSDMISRQKSDIEKSYGEAIKGISLEGEKRKDAAIQEYQQRSNQTANQLNQINQQKQQAIGQIVSGVGQAAGVVAGATIPSAGGTAPSAGGTETVLI